jgi:hypothetical protein
MWGWKTEPVSSEDFRVRSTKCERRFLPFYPVRGRAIRKRLPTPYSSTGMGAD